MVSLKITHITSKLSLIKIDKTSSIRKHSAEIVWVSQIFFFLFEDQSKPFCPIFNFLNFLSLVFLFLKQTKLAQTISIVIPCFLHWFKEYPSVILFLLCGENKRLWKVRKNQNKNRKNKNFHSNCRCLTIAETWHVGIWEPVLFLLETQISCFLLWKKGFVVILWEAT